MKAPTIAKPDNTILITVIANDETLLRAPLCVERPDGTIWHQNELPVVLTRGLPDSDALKAKYKALMAAKQYDKIPSEHLARRGEVRGMRIEWESERIARRDTQIAQAMYPRSFGTSRNGKPYILCDEREEIGQTVTLDGVEFDVAGTGEPYATQLHKVRRVYVSGFRVTPEGNYQAWRTAYMADVERHQYQFKRMMEDEMNDGANPPKPVSDMLAQIVAALKPIERDRDRQIEVYLSSRGWGDYSPVKWRGSSKTPRQDYIQQARALLSSAVDVDHPNPTDEELLAKFEEGAKL